MASVEYSLFRVKMIRPSQRKLFSDPALTAADLFVRAIDERPAVSLRGNVWRVANVEKLDGDQGYQGRFAIGTIKTSRVDIVDRETGDFVEAEFEASPYTYCLYEAKIGLIGVARKQALAKSVGDIISRLQRVISNSSVVRRNEIAVHIDPVRDPSAFLKKIKGAYRVSRFRVWFTGPNPFDADEFFQKPLSIMCQEASATQGRLEVSGEDLDRSVLQEVSRSTVATGNSASVTLREVKGAKKVTIRTDGDAIKKSFGSGREPESILADILKLYNKVRNVAAGTTPSPAKKRKR